METRTPCRFLQPGPVPICAAFDGGLRTPTEAELEHLCQSDRHRACALFQARMAQEYRQVTSGDQGFSTAAARPPKTEEVP